MLIFHDPVSPIQFFGYSIALAGLVYYKLGADGVKNFARDAQLSLGTVRQNHPARAKGLIIGGVFVTLMVVTWFLWPSIPSEYKNVIPGTT